jgi:AraC family transcriptional regulator, ethanolamine operon transcriptional activator
MLGHTMKDGQFREVAEVRLQTRDMDELRKTLSYLGIDVVHLGRGPFGCALHLIHLGPVHVLEVTTDRALHSRGWRPDTFGVNLITPRDVGLSVQRRSVSPGQIATVGPPGDWDHVAAAPLRHFLSFTVDAAYLRQASETLYGRDYQVSLADRVYTPNPEDFSALAADLRFLLTHFSEVVESGPWHAEHLIQRCIGHLLRALAPADLVSEPRRNVSHRRLLQKAVEFMATHLGKPVSLLDICRQVDASERTVHNSFAEVFGLSPMAYFKVLKLNAVRQALRSGDSSGASLREIARKWRFIHPGHFAADYRQLFGELPSDTCRK